MSLDVYQEHLDAVSAALMAGDFEAYMALVDAPLVLITETGTELISTRDEFRVGFDAYSGMLRAHGATHLYRLAASVIAYGDSLLTGRYETHILRGGQRVYGPFPTAGSMRLRDGVWRVCSVVTAEHPDPFPINRRQRAGLLAS